MTQSKGSFTQINYLLRPSKQVERKLIIEALHRLKVLGYDLPSYRYVGFGSIYYADFVLLHRYLYIDDLLCVERNRSIEKRMKFNCPYEFVDLHMGPVSEVFPSLERDRRHVIWLDYDVPLDASVLNDVESALTVLAPGSVLLITVTAQLGEIERAATQQQLEERSKRLVEQYSEMVGRFVPGGVKPNMLNRKRLPQFFADILRAQFTETLQARRDHRLELLQFANYEYADGAKMITFGGLLDEPSNVKRIMKSNFTNGLYYANQPEPTPISLPQLTIREKYWLDQNLDQLDGTAELPFELDEEAIRNYARYYRDYPVYHEALI